MQSSRFLLFILVAICTSGCAKVRFFSDSALTTETGLRFYTAKPYLLLARTGAKEKPVDVSVVYLPDLQNPQYAYYRAGLGANTLTVALANSIPTSYGQTTDVKLPETLSAIGSLVSAAAGVPALLAGGDKLRAEAKNLREEASAEEIRQAATMVTAVAADLRQLEKLMGAKLNKLVREEVLKLASELDGVAAALGSPKAPTELDAIASRLRAVVDETRWKPLEHTATTNDPVDVAARFKQDRDQLQAALQLIAPSMPKPPEVAFELYEIIQTAGTTELRRVEPK